MNRDTIFNFFPGFFSGSYTFNSLASFNRGLPNGSGESYSQNFAGVGTTGAETHPDIIEFAAFAQDEWKLEQAGDALPGRALRHPVLRAAAGAEPRSRSSPPPASTPASSRRTRTTSHRAWGCAWTPNSEDGGARPATASSTAALPSIMVGTAHSNNGVNVIALRFTGRQVPK